MRCRRLIVVAIVAPVLLVACGESEEAVSTSPFQELFGCSSPAEQRAQQLEAEEITAQCMREAGWQYTPVDSAAQVGEQAFEDQNDPAFAQRYGYGRVRAYEIYEWPYIDEDGNYTDDTPFGPEPDDPNADYVNALTGEESNEYFATLYGDQSNQDVSIDPATGEEVVATPSLEEQGCLGKGQSEVFGNQPTSNNDFMDRFAVLSEELKSDPQLLDAEAEWSDCMYDADPTYDIAASQDAVGFVERLVAEAKGLEGMPMDPNTGLIIGGDGTEEFTGITEGSDGQRIAWVGQPRKLTGTEMQDLQRQELAIWKVDDECQEKTGLRDLRNELERDLVDLLYAEFPELDGTASA